MVAREAAEAGMSYGKYVALKYERNGFKPEKRTDESDEEQAGARRCEVCGRILPANARKNTRTCGKVCSYELQKKKNKEYYQMHRKFVATECRICEFCGSEFLPARKDQRFCGDRCRNFHKVYKRRGIAKPPPGTTAMQNRQYGPGTCVICGKEYTKRAPGQMTCSKKCKARRNTEMRRKKKCLITLT